MLTETKSPMLPVSSEASSAAVAPWSSMSSESPLHWRAEVKIGNRRFVVSPSFQVISQCPNESFSGPATVIRSNEGRVTAEFLSQTVKRFKKTDDIFHEAFLKTILVVGAEIQKTDDNVSNLLSEWNARLSFAPTTCEQIEGPCYIIDGRCYAVWKLFPDIQGAFFVAILPAGHNKYQPLQAGAGPSLEVAVPSRLYYPKLPSKPLNGMRVSIKDNIDLSGIKTSLSSRAWNALYPEVADTAPAVQYLIDLGAVILGKTVLSQFAEVENPTGDWVDYHCPFNPRGDGYLIPEGSSSGAGASLAAYDWLDISIGTDTGGSIRDPASMHGLFGIRPTFGSLSMNGVFPLARALDTVGFMTRDAAILESVCGIWYPKTIAHAKPTRLIRLSDYEYKNDQAQEVFESFLSHVEAHLNVKSISLRLDDIWKEKNPSDTGESMVEYVGKKGTVMKTIKNFDLWNNTQQFRDDYSLQFRKEPYSSPAIASKLPGASQVTKEDQDAALVRKDVFKSWFLSEIISDPGTVIVLPISESEPEYRDEYRGGPWVGVGSGWHRNFISVLSGCPELIVPIGQIPYESRVSKRTESLPVVGSFVGYPGSDDMLAKMIHELLVEQELPTTVLTGPTCF